MLERAISFSLRNRTLLILLGAAVLVYGGYSYSRLPVDAFPDVSPNLVQVFTETEGLAPEEVEQYVTYPIEVAMNGLPGIEDIRSVSNFGLSVVNVYFEDGVDIYFARQLVNERLQEARYNIPEGFGDPEMGPISTGMGLVLFYYLEDTTGTRDLMELRSIQDWLIKYNLQTVPGVTEVLGIGGYEKQFQVEVDPNSLLRYGITLPEVIQRIRDNNLNTGAQFIRRNDEEFVVRSVGLASTVRDLEMIVVKAVDGVPVRLGDLADVREGGAIRRGLQTRNGVQEVVAGQVVKLFGANSSTVIAAVEKKLAEINRILPPGVRLVPYYDQKSLVEACVHTVVNALLQGILLVVLVLFAFMGGFRPSLVVALSLPFSVLFSFILMRHFGISANLMSLGGVAIAIGMIVDGAVVMVDNADRHLASAPPVTPRTVTVRKACREVVRPIAFAVLIIAVVFIPLFSLQGIEGKTFRPLAQMVALAMTGSLVFTVLFVPVIASLLMRQSNRGGRIKAALDRFEVGSTAAFSRLLKRFLDQRGLAVTVAVLTLLLGALAFSQLGSEFKPELKEGTIIVKLTMAPSISLEKSREITMSVERRILEIPEVREVVSRIGRGEVGAHTDPINTAEVYVLFHPRESWRTARNQDDLERELREHLGDVPGVLMNYVQPIEQTVNELLEGSMAELSIKIFGEDLDRLKGSADKVAAAVSEVRGAADVQPDQVSGTPQLLIKLDRQAIARYGINVSDVQEVLRAAVGGETASQIFEGARRYDVTVRFPESFRATGEDIGRILIDSPSGARVPLSQLATLQEIIGPRQITRQNSQRFISVQCNVVGRDIGSFVEEAQQAIEKEVNLPPGQMVTWGGSFRLQQEANQRLSLITPATLLLVLFLLYSAFGSFRHSFLIMLNIPLGLVGGLAALWISGQNLSVPASVGLIALLGISVENGMVLVTYLKQLAAGGCTVREAALMGACRRLRPVLMTAATTALGLIPLLFSHGTGSEVQRPLATVVVGGLVTSTILTLLVLPVVFAWMEERVQRKKAGERFSG